MIKTIQIAKQIITILALSSSFLSVQIYAQSVTASLTITAGAGGLSIDTSGVSCSLSATVSTTNQTASCTLSGVSITDVRGTGVGWVSTYTVRNFASGSNLINLCTDTSCTTRRLSINWQAVNTVSGNSYGSTDTTGSQQPSSLTGTTSTDTTNSMSLVAFNNASQTYGQAVVTNGGSGYSSAPTVVFTGGNCTQNPAATSTISSGKVTAINISTPGLGCTSAPTISFSSEEGGSATATIIAGAGEGNYTKSTTTSGFSLTVPSFVHTGTYSSILTFSAA